MLSSFDEMQRSLGGNFSIRSSNNIEGPSFVVFCVAFNKTRTSQVGARLNTKKTKSHLYVFQLRAAFRKVIINFEFLKLTQMGPFRLEKRCFPNKNIFKNKRASFHQFFPGKVVLCRNTQWWLLISYTSNNVLNFYGSGNRTRVCGLDAFEANALATIVTTAYRPTAIYSAYAEVFCISAALSFLVAFVFVLKKEKEVTVIVGRL